MAKRLSLREAADMLGVSDETLRLWCQGPSPRVPHFRIGKCYQFEVSDITAYLEQSRVTVVGHKPPLKKERRKLTHI